MNANKSISVYYVIGSDHKEYGPVTVDEIRQWAAEGRVHRATVARHVDEKEWKTLGILPELEKYFPPPAGLKPSTPVATRHCGLATWALICGALGFSCVTAPVGLVLGLAAHSEIRRSGGRLTGSAMATAGIVLSLSFMLLILLGVALPAVSAVKEKAQRLNCIKNVREVEMGIMAYANAHSNRFPSAATWCDSVKGLVTSPEIFLCTKGDAEKRSHYAFNTRLDGVETATLRNPGAIVLIFECEGAWNANGGPELMLKSSRHGKSIAVGFADGHVELVHQDGVQRLRWEP